MERCDSAEVYRILDANINRSREALRVIEEYFRFVRNDSAFAGRTKTCRHKLTRIVDALGENRQG